MNNGMHHFIFSFIITTRFTNGRSISDQGGYTDLTLLAPTVVTQIYRYSDKTDGKVGY